MDHSNDRVIHSKHASQPFSNWWSLLAGSTICAPLLSCAISRFFPRGGAPKISIEIHSRGLKRESVANVFFDPTVCDYARMLRCFLLSGIRHLPSLWQKLSFVMFRTCIAQLGVQRLENTASQGKYAFWAIAALHSVCSCRASLFRLGAQCN